MIAIDRSHIEYKLITSTKANCIFIVPERNYIKINKYKNLRIPPLNVSEKYIYNVSLFFPIRAYFFLINRAPDLDVHCTDVIKK